MAAFVTNPETPLVQLSAQDVLTLRNAYEGIIGWGGVGSGKTSGLGKAIASAFLRAGMGGLVLCAKPEEVDLWLDYARQNGRADSVRVFDQTQGFNFIAYELFRQGLDGMGTVVDCFMRILEASDLASGEPPGGGSEARFWTDTTKQLLHYSIPLLYVAYGDVTVNSIIEFVMSVPTTKEQSEDDAWMDSSFAIQTMTKAALDPVIPIAEHRLQALLRFWNNQFQRIPEKTRGNILISLSSRLDRFRHGRMQTAFCGETTLVPEMCFHGTIILMAMPALSWNEDGVVGQHLFKYMWQRAVESRNGLGPEQSERPVFLWADEAQYFVNEKDEAFISTSRASRACVCFLTQTLPSFYARLGKNRTDAADGLVGKFATQVFFQNACVKTNEYASTMIGRTLQTRYTTGRNVGSSRTDGMNDGGSNGTGTSSNSGGSSSSQGESSNSSYGSSSNSGSSWGHTRGRGTSESESWGTSEQMDFLIPPKFFATSLKTGGPRFQNQVSGVWFRAGARFTASGGENCLMVTFQQ